MANKKIIVMDSKIYGKDTTIAPRKAKKVQKFYLKNRNERKTIKKSFKFKFERFRQNFSNWLHTKNATRLMIFLIVAVLAVSGVLIWGAVSKEKPSKFFIPDVSATINVVENGTNTMSDATLKLSELEGKINKDRAKHYSSFILTAKETNATIGLNNLYFVLYSANDAEYEFKLTLLHRDFTQNLEFSRNLNLHKNQTNQFNIPIQKAIKAPNQTTQLKLEFLAKGNSASIMLSQMIFVS